MSRYSGFRSWKKARRIGEDFTKLETTEDGTGRLRRELLTLIQNAPLTQGTEFARNFPERLARWSVLNSTIVEKTSSLSGTMAVIGQLPSLNAGAAFATIAQSMRPPLLAQQMLRDNLIDARDDLVDAEKPVPPELETKIKWARREYELGALDELLTIFTHRPWLVEKTERERRAAQDVIFRQIEAHLSLILDEAREERQQAYDKLWPQLPPSRLCGRDLLRLNLDEAQDFVGQVALENRLDLMNQQALLADSWRIIAVFANSLLGTFDVRYNATMLAPPPGVIGQGFNFDGNNTRHQIIFNTELPLVRRIERNNYRASLIVYQRQRRNLQAVQDTIMLQVRSRVRRLQQLEETYKIQQRALLLLYSQVNQAREQLQAPPDPGVTRDTAAAAGTATLQLLQAQRGVPQAQTNLYTTWINYLVTRMELYRDLELMQIDSRGVWIDDHSSPPAR
ncbi:MAG: TolC family protein [Gemmatales bacterium]